MADGAFAAQWFCKDCVDRTGVPYLNFGKRATCRLCQKPKAVVAKGGGGKAGGKGGGGGGGKGGGGGGGKGGGGGGGQAAAAKLYTDQRAKETRSTTAQAKKIADLEAKVAELTKAKVGDGTCPASTPATSSDVGQGEEGEDQGGDLVESIAQKDKDLRMLEAVLKGTPTEGLQGEVDKRRAELQELRDKRRSGKPPLTQLRDLDGRIRRKTEQLGKKVKAREVLQERRDKVEKERAEIDREEEQVVKEEEEDRAALKDLQSQRAQVELLAASGAQEAASQQRRNNEAKVQEAVEYLEGLRKLGAVDDENMQNLRQLLEGNSAVGSNGGQRANDMETDELGAGPGLGGDDLGNEDFNSDDGRAVDGHSPPVDTAPGRGRSGVAERGKSEDRSRSASSRRRKLDSGKPAGA